ncbi:hypothetical protein Q5P01_017076 [Channa striata]|uniref:Uncharacterized protein n=1 Tax=Channa striata TaxID=64152 RepID=A0AA88MCG4_CHASR|nr:hypothetical protein Q5P01_017076 [Channa striata]
MKSSDKLLVLNRATDPSLNVKVLLEADGVHGADIPGECLRQSTRCDLHNARAGLENLGLRTNNRIQKTVDELH